LEYFFSFALSMANCLSFVLPVFCQFDYGTFSKIEIYHYFSKLYIKFDKSAIMRLRYLSYFNKNLLS
jgi:hypothetical protein